MALYQDLRLWTEKYRPLSLSDASVFFHGKICNFLTRLASNPAFPHILFYGPPGAGKRTLIKSLLKELYQTDSVHRMVSDHKEFKHHSATVECVVMSSNYHVEVTPSEAEVQDRVIVQKLIKEVASSHQIDEKQQKSFKVLVIHEMDNLSLEAQAALRRTMETYMPYCRIIGNAESLSKVILPLRSRCLLVRVNAPTFPQISNVLLNIALNEKNLNVPEDLANKISRLSRRNLRRAITMMQNITVRSNAYQSPSPPEYELKAREIARQTLKEQSATQLKTIRNKFYDLLTKGISADMIMGIMVREFLQRQSSVPESVKPQILKYAVTFEHRCRDGTKPVIHLEAFIARVMELYRHSEVQIKKH